MLTHPTHDALRALKLDGMAEVLAELLAREDSRQMDPIEWIGLMLDRESASRDTRRFQTRLRAAKLRDSTACLEDVDYTFPRKLDRALFQSLRDSVWISKARPILITGPSGTGKTHIALGLGLSACQKGLSVGFVTAAALVHELMEARDERRLLRLQKQMVGYKLLIIDELGFVPLSKTGAELLFELISQRYERGSTLITSNLPFDEWTETFGSERLTGALLDRLTHHVNILEMNGESYRLGQSKARQAAPKT